MIKDLFDREYTNPDTRKNPKIEKIEKKLEKLAAIDGLYNFVMSYGYLAGGAVRDVFRGVEPKDWDIFFKSDAIKDEFIEKFAKNMDKTGLGNYNFEDFQFITVITGRPQDVVQTFDWNVNMMFYDFSTKQRSAWNSLDSTYLRFNCDSRKPLGSFLRLPAMLEKGYKIEPQELLFIASFLAQCTPIRGKVDLKDEFEFVSSGGGYVGSSAANEAVHRATIQADKRSPLKKLL